MLQIIQLQGTEKRLYELVAPLVMNQKVLKQNNNYPFRTSEHFIWFIAVEEKQVVGFVPVECRKSECIINNYYAEDNKEEILRALIEKIISDINKEKELVAIALMENRLLFKEFGFSVKKEWTRYLKLVKEKRDETG